MDAVLVKEELVVTKSIENVEIDDDDASDASVKSNTNCDNLINRKRLAVISENNFDTYKIL